MSSSFFSSHNLPFLSDFSAEDRRLAEMACSDLEERKKALATSRERIAEELADQVRRQIQNLLGPEKARELRQLMRRERLALRDLCQPPGGLTLDFTKANRSRKERADRLLRGFGISREQLAKIGADAWNKLHEAIGQVDGKVTPGYNLALNVEAWKELSPFHQVALPWGEVAPPLEDPDDPHRWFLFRPPFFGFDWSSELWGSDGFRVERDHVLSPQAGLIGNDVTMDDDDAGDNDGAWADVETRIAFGFEPPTAGLIEVLIDAQSAMAEHYVRTKDEWGWSDSHTEQHNYLMLRVLHPNVPESSLALMDEFTWESSSDETVDRENLIRGQHYYADLLSSGPVPGNQSVVIEVGTRSWDKS